MNCQVPFFEVEMQKSGENMIFHPLARQVVAVLGEGQNTVFQTQLVLLGAMFPQWVLAFPNGNRWF